MPVRVAELMAVVASAGDFAKGYAEEQALRTCRAGMRLADRAGLSGEDRQAVFYLSLLRFVGCTATASEMAAALGDEIAVSAAFAAVDPRNLRSVIGTAAGLVGGSGPRRALGVARFLRAAPAVIREHEVTSCEVARLFAERIGLPEGVRAGLGQVFERYDGHGHPGLVAGPSIALPVRVEQLANAIELNVDLAGWAGSLLDPSLVRLARSAGPAPNGDLDVEAVLAAEPEPWLTYDDDGLDRALAALADVVDLKSVWLRGHSRGVAALAALAASSPADARLLRRAGWLHDLGRLAVSSSVWDKPGTLSLAQWEQVRLHPYVTDRVLRRCGELAEIAAVAGAHHERADGSGYHRGTVPDRLGALLAAADVYTALGEDRPHRPAVPVAERAAVLRAERLPPWAVDAVLASTTTARLGAAPAVPALTEREREVLALVARGATNRAAATALGISAKTVNAHLEHIFAKLGVSTRGAAVFAALSAGLVDAPSGDRPM
jgi:HD-GYP domain-containing protein (c-di-GMP phosphodiesterase class II)/DNA-binding CsgD family transcriptional regulator